MKNKNNLPEFEITVEYVFDTYSDPNKLIFTQNNTFYDFIDFLNSTIYRKDVVYMVFIDEEAPLITDSFQSAKDSSITAYRDLHVRYNEHKKSINIWVLDCFEDAYSIALSLMEHHPLCYSNKPNLN